MFIFTLKNGILFVCNRIQVSVKKSNFIGNVWSSEKKLIFKNKKRFLFTENTLDRAVKYEAMNLKNMRFRTQISPKYF